MSYAELQAIGNRISERRKQLGFTQELIAEKMNVSVQMVSNLERGNKAIKIENLLKVSDILGVSTDYILKGRYNDKDFETIVSKLSNLNERDLKMIEMLIDYCLNE